MYKSDIQQTDFSLRPTYLITKQLLEFQRLRYTKRLLNTLSKRDGDFGGLLGEVHLFVNCCICNGEKGVNKIILSEEKHYTLFNHMKAT